MNFLNRVFIFWTLFCIFPLKAIDLPCRPTKESSEMCVVTKKGDFTNETVVIISNKAPEIKHIKVMRVNLGHIPAFGLKNFRKIEAVTFEGCGIESLDGLKSLRSVQQIFLNRNNVSTIPDAKFNAKVVYIEAQYNKLENISKNAFKNLENLYWLDLSYNRIKKLPRKLFVHNSVLTSINLSNNRIKNIRHVFRKQVNLRFLRLSQNKVERVTSETFKSLENLRELDLSNNKITHVDPHAFDTCRSLFLLNLSKNLLKHLHITVPNKGLSFLYLMDNHFNNLTVDYKEKPTRLLLDASNADPIFNTSTTTKLKLQKGLSVSTLNLANNHLSDVNAIASTTKLQKLSLANNTLLGNSSLMRLLTLTEIIDINAQGINMTLEQLSIFLQIKSLRILDVSNNKRLNSMKWNPPTKPLIKLLMNNCSLTQINVQELKRSFPKLQEIHIKGNLFTCEYLQEILAKLHSVGVRAQIDVTEIRKCKSGT